MSVNTVLGFLLLAVLLAPLLAAVVIATAGRTARGLPRRLAVYAAALHLVLTGGAVALYAGFVPTELNTGANVSLTFQPKGVPGDASADDDSRSLSYDTSWKMLALTPDAAAPAVHFYVGFDGLNVLLVALTSLMFFFAVLVSWDTVRERTAAYYGWLFLLQAAVTGAFVSFDILLFYIFFELTLVPAFFLIGQWGTGSARRDAARKFVLYTLFGSLFTLVGIIGVVLTNPMPLNPATGRVRTEPTLTELRMWREAGELGATRAGPITFSIPTLMKNVGVWDTFAHAAVATAEARLAKAGPNQKADRERDLADAQEKLKDRGNVQFWLFLALIAGFAVKVPIVPLHTWLPATYAEAPLPVTMVFSAVLAKLGTFGILRLVIPLLPEACVQYGLPLFGTLGAVGIVFAALCAFAQRDLRLLAGYSSVSHLGFLVIGLFAMNPEGLSGAVLHMVNHGLTAGAMFALLSFLARRYRTLDANQYGGLWAKYPRFTFFTLVIVLANVGLPGLNNFVSEMLMLGGLFQPLNLKAGGWGLPFVAALGVLLSSWYLFTMLKRVFFGPLVEPPLAGEADAVPTDVTGREFVPLASLAALCLALGLFPQPLLDATAGDVRRVANAVDRARYRLDPGAFSLQTVGRPVPEGRPRVVQPVMP